MRTLNTFRDLHSKVFLWLTYGDRRGKQWLTTEKRCDTLDSGGIQTNVLLLLKVETTHPSGIPNCSGEVTSSGVFNTKKMGSGSRLLL